MNNQHLRLRQVSRRLQQTSEWQYTAPPTGGWLRSLREAFGLTLRQQASRIGISAATLHVHEKNEPEGHITLEQLRKLAAALNCVKKLL